MPTPPPSEPPLHQRLREQASTLVEAVPHARALGMVVTDVQRGEAWARVPYRDELIGDLETGVIAGGVITTLLDNLSGLAVIAALDHPAAAATIDLRIDYMRSAEPGCAILAHAQCHHVTRSVAFVRAVAFERSPEDPIALSTGAFMITPFTPAGEARGG